MTSARSLLLSTLALTLLAGLTAGIAQVEGAPALPAAFPVGGVTVLEARPFTLAEPATHEWRSERPQYTAGVLLVLDVEDHELVLPRQVAEPILYVGAQTAARLNHGYESGRVIAIVPATTDADGAVVFDLAGAPIFFGTPGLPEQVDAETATRERAAAVAAGLPATTTPTTAVHAPVAFENDHQLHVFAADLIEQHSPAEKDLVAGLRAPLLTR